MITGSTEICATDLAGKPALGLFVAPETDSLTAPEAQLPVPAGLVDAFAEATGWVIGFEETNASFCQRAQTGSRRPTGGKLKIVDMSSTWPAKTPTAHRAKCDRVVAALNGLISLEDEQ